MGLEAQRDAVRKYAKAEGYELQGVVQEAASGAAREGELFSLEHRHVLSELVTCAERHEYDVLLVATLDRLSRDQVEQLYVKRLLQRFGVTVVSAAGETNGEGAIGELVERLIGAVHDFDRKRVLERLRAGKVQGRRLGRVVDGYGPYGYRQAGAGKLEIVEEQAEVVRRIFREAKTGLGPGPIARGLNDDGVSGPRGGQWNRQSVTNLLRSPLYAGELHGVKGAQPAIVSRRLFNMVQ
jgi:DNA invertase Pin-like site-specific DNA recombinase